MKKTREGNSMLMEWGTGGGKSNQEAEGVGDKQIFLLQTGKLEIHHIIKIYMSEFTCK